GERLGMTVRRGLDQPDAGQQTSLLDMLGMMGESVASTDQAALVLRALAPDVAKKAADGEMLVRTAAGRALGRMHADPAVAIPVLAALLHGPTAGREAGAGGILGLVNIPSRTVDTRRYPLEMSSEASEAIVAYQTAASPLAEALQDGRVPVRRVCAKALALMCRQSEQLAECLPATQEPSPNEDSRRQ